MKRGYYFLVSSLADYQFDSDAKGLKLLTLRKEVASLLSNGDRELMALMYSFYDLQNIIALRGSRGESFTPLGNIERSGVESIIDYMAAARPTDEDIEALPAMPPFIWEMVERFKVSAEAVDEEDIYLGMGFEKALYEGYYNYIAKKGGSFLSRWYGFDCELRNICAAFSAREAMREVEKEVIGGGEIVDALTRSALPDFGLKGEVDYIDQLITAIDSDNIVEKERKIDLIRWQRVEEMNTFDYFNVDFILGYMIRLGILYRWIALDRERGREFFNKMVEALSDKKMLEKSA